MRKQLIVMEDDVDGSKAVETVHFAIDNVSYEIDLSASHADELRKAIGPYLGAARRTGGRVTKRAAKSSQSDSALIDNKAVRAWAAATGVKLSARGRIPAEVIEQYRAAGH